MIHTTDTPLEAGSEVIAFHDRMLAKGRSFYGVAVQPQRGKEGVVRGELERILTSHGYAPRIININGHLVFEGEYSPEAMEDVRKYLTSIENQTPSPPVMRRGDYFQMGAYKWLDGVVERPKFNGHRR